VLSKSISLLLNGYSKVSLRLALRLALASVGV